MKPILIYSKVHRPFIPAALDPETELAALVRETLARIRAKHATEQCGEAFEGLDTVAP